MYLCNMTHFMVQHPRQKLTMEEVKHDYLKTEKAKPLLAKLQQIFECFDADSLFVDTLREYHAEMSLSCLLVSDKQYKQVHLAVENAKNALEEFFGTTECVFVKTTDVYVKGSGSTGGGAPNAFSYALPGNNPIIVINSGLVDLMNEGELQAAILHELGHILYTHTKYASSMKMLFEMLSDGSLVHEAMAECDMQQYNQIRVGYELTADRVMFLGMNQTEGGWAVIQNMFAKVAGGVKKIDVNGNEFLQQYQRVDPNMRDAVCALMQQKNPHPPLLRRLFLLDEFRQTITP